ncbi:hypothetical protein [uncultured Paenibacillus sp.]|uniref:hypothetical protein n=1 Tax=uncultured Paenibacillus sp. TaxID=227322 RepID=UPI0028D4BEB6|nr:hypothetical protein [uncultured Paenibacillus sp.]
MNELLWIDDEENDPVGTVTGVRFLLPPSIATNPDHVAAVRKFLEDCKLPDTSLEHSTNLDHDGNLVIGCTCTSGIIDVFILNDLSDMFLNLQDRFSDMIDGRFNSHRARLEVLICCDDGEYVVVVDPRDLRNLLCLKAEQSW